MCISNLKIIQFKTYLLLNQLKNNTFFNVMNKLSYFGIIQNLFGLGSWRLGLYGMGRLQKFIKYMRNQGTRFISKI